MLNVKNIRKSFSGVEAIKGCTLEVEKNKITGLIGPNGAGKTTLFNIIAGTIKANQGTIVFKGEDITSYPPYKAAGTGLVRTFQIPHEFKSMTVFENLVTAYPNQKGENIFNVIFKPSTVKIERDYVKQKAWELLQFLGLDEKADIRAGSLSGGQKKLLELGRGLMVNPDILLLDEPIAGVNPVLAAEIKEKILKLNEEGMTFLIIEHEMGFIMDISEVIYVLADGAVMKRGTPKEIMSDKEVIDAYLGGE